MNIAMAKNMSSFESSSFDKNFVQSDVGSLKNVVKNTLMSLNGISMRSSIPNTLNAACLLFSLDQMCSHTASESCREDNLSECASFPAKNSATSEASFSERAIE